MIEKTDKLSECEKEAYITSNNGNKTASICSYDAGFNNRLVRYVDTYPEFVTTVEMKVDNF